MNSESGLKSSGASGSAIRTLGAIGGKTEAAHERQQHRAEIGQRLRFSDPCHKSREQRETPCDIEVEAQSGQKPGGRRGNRVHVRLDQMHDLVAEFRVGRSQQLRVGAKVVVEGAARDARRR